MNDYMTSVGAGLIAAGLVISETEAVEVGDDHSIIVRVAAGELSLIWNAELGWAIGWLATDAERGRQVAHSLTVHPDPGDVVDEVLRILGGLT